MLDNFVDSPKWSAFVANDGKDYDDVKGEIEYENQPVVYFTIQCWWKKETFEMYYFGINEISQDIFMQALLVEEMCAASK